MPMKQALGADCRVRASREDLIVMQQVALAGSQLREGGSLLPGKCSFGRRDGRRACVQEGIWLQLCNRFLYGLRMQLIQDLLILSGIDSSVSNKPRYLTAMLRVCFMFLTPLGWWMVSNDG